MKGLPEPAKSSLKQWVIVMALNPHNFRVKRIPGLVLLSSDPISEGAEWSWIRSPGLGGAFGFPLQASKQR